MEKCETTFCKLCLNFIIDENFRVVDEFVKKVLDVLLFKLGVEENHEPVICNACIEKLFAAFDFKVTCTNTEDSIFSYINSENETPVDLREIYVKLRGKEPLSVDLKDEKICRLCMQFNTCGFTKVEEIESDMIQKFIPEVNFKSTKDPVICSLCLDSLKVHSSFLKNCMSVQETIPNFDEDCATDTPSYIKIEEIEVKIEEYKENGVTSPHGDELVDDKINVGKSTNLNDLKHKNSKMYKCDACDYKIKYKSRLLRHQLKHKDFSEVQVYECETCFYKTKRRTNFVDHQLIHKDFSKVPEHKCNICDYRSKRKRNLIRHQLTHKDVTDVQIYKQDKCD